MNYVIAHIWVILGAILGLTGGFLVPQNRWLSAKCIIGMICLVPTSFLLPGQWALFFLLAGAVVAILYNLARYGKWKRPGSIL